MRDMGAGIGMLVVETIAKIRRAFFVQEKPIKVICRELRVSRKVVRKVIRSEATEFRYERGTQPLPKIGPEVDPIGGTTGPSFLIGNAAGSDLLDHAAQVVCCCCRGGHVGDARASSKRSVMSTALSVSGPLVPSRQTAIGVRPASA